MRPGGGADEPGLQTAHSPSFSCGGTEPHGSRADSARACAQHGAGDRPDRHATQCRQRSTAAGVFDARTDPCGPCFECSAPHWLIRQDRSCSADARTFVRSQDAFHRCSARGSSSTCSCPAWDPSDFPTCSYHTRHFCDFRASVSVWHAGCRIQDECTTWTQLQARCRHGTAA